MEHLLEVRKRVLEALSATHLIRAGIEGRPDRDLYVRYLINAYHYAGHSPKVMAIAAARCMDDHPELAAYLLHHADEERGHDQWALADLRALGVELEEVRATPPVVSCSAMIGFVNYVAAFANPVGLFGWMYILEAVGEDLGGAVARKIEGTGQFANSLRFVAGHGIADVGHTHELTEQIQTDVRRDEDRVAVDRVADVVSELYVRMFREIGQEPAR